MVEQWMTVAQYQRYSSWYYRCVIGNNIIITNNNNSYNIVLMFYLNGSIQIYILFTSV